MFLTALVLVAVAVCLCLAGIRKTFALLQVDPMATFVWLGLAEVPAPDVPPRSRPAR